MGIVELQELRAQYERELIHAQAKIEVIDDIISRFDVVTPVEDECENDSNIFTENT